MVMLMIVLACAIWVLIDASAIGVKRGLVTGLGNMGPWGWFACTLGLWIIAFPAYLIYRPRFKDALRAAGTTMATEGTAQPDSSPDVTLSAWSIAAFYSGILSILLIPAPVAVVSGILALREINNRPFKSGKGRAIFGIVAGAIALSLFALGTFTKPSPPHS
jgi:hypothetical protein